MERVSPALRQEGSQVSRGAPTAIGSSRILSFDVEEHDRIEAAAGLHLLADLRQCYRERLADPTRWIVETLGRRQIQATFFIVGQLAHTHPELVRSIHRAGHEVASHSWAHRRALNMTPEEFRVDLRRSRDALEQVIGEQVVGFRAPTFSITRRNPWAIDVLFEEGFLYDSSIYPVRHDRYGVPTAPRAPFRAKGISHSILELPPATLRLGRTNLPVGGGGYFRLFPPALMRWGLWQTARTCRPPVATLYFHPWEFDPGQPRLPLKPLSRFRTYVGISRTRKRLECLIDGRTFIRAVDIARELLDHPDDLTVFPLDLSSGSSERPDSTVPDQAVKDDGPN